MRQIRLFSRPKEVPEVQLVGPDIDVLLNKKVGWLSTDASGIDIEDQCVLLRPVEKTFNSLNDRF